MVSRQITPWPVNDPFVVHRDARPGDIDAFGHVNNLRYIDWAMDAAWAHSEDVGVTFNDYQRIGSGCVVRRHEFHYVAPVTVGDRVTIATWISENDNRVRVTRAFEFRNDAGQKLFEGQTFMVVVDLASGRPSRMPQEFVAAYKVSPPIKR